jgi:TonB family protein
MAAAAPSTGGDRRAPRRTLAFSLSLLLHLAFVLLIFGAIRQEMVSPPLEVSILGTAPGMDSGSSGEQNADSGRSGASAGEVKPVDAAPLIPSPKVRRVPQKPARQSPAPESSSIAVDEPNAATVAPALDATAPDQRDASPPSAGIALRESGTDDEAASGSGAGTDRDGTNPGGFSVSGGGRSYASIWQGTQRYLSGLRWAYNNELRNNARLRGVIVVRYEILADGAVGEVAMVSSQLQAPHLEQQVLSQIRDWRYLPEPTGTVVVTWPLSFRPPR